MSAAMPDKDFEAMKALINTTIHELVFAVAFAEDDDIDGAQNAIMTAQGNLDRVGEQLVPFGN